MLLNNFKLRGVRSLVSQCAHNAPPLGLVGSNPTPAIFALVAQLIEHLTCNEDVIGLNPIGGSSFREYGEVGESRQTVNLLPMAELVRIHLLPFFALVAQGIEQRTSNPLVAGSNPAGCAI